MMSRRAAIPKALVVAGLLVGFLALFGGAADAGSDDYYKLLGVPRDASQADIKRAFRRLSVKFAHTPRTHAPTAQ